MSTMRIIIKKGNPYFFYYPFKSFHLQIMPFQTKNRVKKQKATTANKRFLVVLRFLHKIKTTSLPRLPPPLTFSISP